MNAPQVHRHPAWFGAVLGTAATSVVVLMQGETWSIDGLAWVAVGFLLLASLLAIVLWPRYAVRLANRESLMAELADPGHGAMLATLPAGMLVLAVAWGKVGPELVATSVAVWVDIVLLVVGVVLSLVLGIAWAGAIASNTNDLASVHGGWLIPPVMNLVVPLGLLPVAALYPEQATWLLFVGFLFFGVGVVLYLVIFTMLVTRIALRPRALPQLAPSLFIPLAPAGILGFALLRQLQAAGKAGLPGFDAATAGLVVSMMGIGVGLWWAAFAGFELRRIHRESGVPFHPGWWGFVFPVAAMTLAITGVGNALDAPGIEAFGALGAVILIIVWLVVAVRSVRLVRGAATR